MPQLHHAGDHVRAISDHPGVSIATFPEPPAWYGDALCASTDPEAFYPDKGENAREAKTICSRCTVQTECLDYALDNDERWGVWGGLSERERRRLKHQMTAPPSTTPSTTAIHNQQEPA